MIVSRVVVILLLWYCQSVYSTTFSDSYQKVVKLLNGDQIVVLATPHYCGDPPPTGNNLGEEIKWRVDGVGSCKKIYTPDASDMFTPLSHGGEISQFFFDDKKYENLLSAIKKMSRLVPPNLKPLHKLDVQLTFWELVSVLEWRRDLKIDWQPKIDQDRMDTLLAAANVILSKVLFTKENISEINKIANEAAYFNSNKNELVQGCYFEVDQPGRIHESMSQGRLYGRIFIGTTKNSSCNLLKELVAKGERYSMSILPELVDGFRSVLVLQYNILDENYNLVSTDYIHGWRENSYTGLMDQSKNIVDKLGLVNFLVINRKKDLNFAKQIGEYQVVSPGQQVRLALLDVNPVYGAEHGAKVTSSKGNCYSCHSSKVKTFDFRSVGGADKLTFSSPFKNSGNLYRNEPLYNKITSSFRLWADKYIKSSH